MNFYITNTLTNKLEIFKPIKKDKISLYVCGPTVYDYPHIGNARSTVVYDILYRILIFLYGIENVVYVRNITDIDDKIIDRSKSLGISISELTKKTTEYFHQDMNYLNNLAPTYEPKATEHLDDIQYIINKLLENNHAYISDDHVYFSVESFKNYGELSGRKLDDLISGARIEINENKKHPEDFVLWKPSKKDDPAFSNFESKWGYGRPGWHIECSAMSHHYLGESFDIHGGGADLIFPHHTNEIAQSCSAFKGSSYAKYWIHNGFLTVNGEKMSKSLGNFVTVNDVRNSSIDGQIVRVMFLNKHYRSPLDYNNKSIEDSKKFLDYLYRALEKTNTTSFSKKIEIDAELLSYLLNDMNTHSALSRLHEIAKKIHSSFDKDKDKNKIDAEILLKSGQFIGIFSETYSDWFNKSYITKDIEDLIEKRNIAKKEKNYQLADSIRNELKSKNIILEDSVNGTTKWRKI